MIFNTSIEHNIKVHEAFLNEGLNSYYVDSLMSKEDRDNNIDKFINDDNGIMNNVMYRDWETDRKSTRLNSSHRSLSRMPSSA